MRIDDGERLLLFDPLALPSELGELANPARDGDRAHRAVARARHGDPSSRRSVSGLHASAETAEDLMQKYGITAEQAGDGSPT